MAFLKKHGYHILITLVDEKLGLCNISIFSSIEVFFFNTVSRYKHFF